MELYQYIKSMDSFTEDWPESIISSILFARNHYHEEIGPDEMADAAHLSRYHFSRLFKQTTGITPIQYLTKLRIQKRPSYCIKPSIQSKKLLKTSAMQMPII